MANLKRTLNEWEPRVRSILRIVVGLLFMQHGAQKLFGFPASPMPPNAPPRPAFELMSQMGIAGVLEFFGGLLFALGLFTRPVAFLLSGQMAVAYFQVHAPRDFWPVINQGELAALYCFVFFYYVFAGPGPWSLDRLLLRHEN
jgi:putative oxidoreductase